MPCCGTCRLCASRRKCFRRRSAHPGVDWRRVADFRNRLVHDYLGVDLEIVWKVVAEDLPELKRVIGGPKGLAESEAVSGGKYRDYAGPGGLTCGGIQ